MRKRTSGLILSGILAVGVVGAVAVTPASATLSSNPVTSRLASIKSALSGLVSDGTLTQKQADKVAGTLASKLPKGGLHGRDGRAGPRGRFGGAGAGDARAAAAKALGLTTDKLRAALQSGKTLAQVARDQNVSVPSLVKALVTATESEITAAVKAGHLTQAQADRIKSSLTQRITDRVNGVRDHHGLGGPRGPGNGGGQRPSAPTDTSGTTSDVPSSTV